MALSLPLPFLKLPSNFITTTREILTIKVIKCPPHVYMTRNFFISLFERAFKLMKNGVYFIVIALLVAGLFKILIYANQMTCDVTLWTQNDVK